MDTFTQEMYQSQKSLYRFGLRHWGKIIPSDEIGALVQETFLGALKSRHTYRGESKLSSWLTEIFKNQVYTYLRKRKREIFIDDIQTVVDGSQANGSVFPEPHTELDQEDELMQQEAVARMRAAVARLSPVHREAIVLYYYDELSVDEIARRLNILESTVKTRIFYARKALRERLVGQEA